MRCAQIFKFSFGLTAMFVALFCGQTEANPSRIATSLGPLETSTQYVDDWRRILGRGFGHIDSALIYFNWNYTKTLTIAGGYICLRQGLDIDVLDPSEKRSVCLAIKRRPDRRMPIITDLDRWKTRENVRLGSRREAVLSAYGQPMLIRRDRNAEVLVYNRSPFRAEFTCTRGRIVEIFLSNSQLPP